MISDNMLVLVRSLDRQLKFDNRFEGSSLKRLLDDWSHRCISDDDFLQKMTALSDLSSSWVKQVTSTLEVSLSGRCCRAQVDKLFESESLNENISSNKDCTLGCPGWAPFNGREQEAEVQRCDACDRFASDQDAASHIAKALGIEPKFPGGF